MRQLWVEIADGGPASQGMTNQGRSEIYPAWCERGRLDAKQGRRSPNGRRDWTGSLVSSSSALPYAHVSQAAIRNRGRGISPTVNPWKGKHANDDAPGRESQTAVNPCPAASTPPTRSSCENLTTTGCNRPLWEQQFIQRNTPASPSASVSDRDLTAETWQVPSPAVDLFLQRLGAAATYSVQ
jgi:hypothetical protein